MNNWRHRSGAWNFKNKTSKVKREKIRLPFLPFFLRPSGLAVCAMSLMNRMNRPREVSIWDSQKKTIHWQAFFKLARIFLFSSPRERLSRILIKAWLKSPRCLVSSFADQFVPTLLQSCRMLRCAPAREIKSGKGFAEAPESKTGFLFLQLYIRTRHPHSQEDFIC